MESWMRATCLLVAATGVLAMASCNDSDEEKRAAAGAPAGSSQALKGDAQSAKIDAQQAITAATTAVPGSAQEVRLESRAGKPAYEVMVLPKGGNSRVRVEVDAMSGQVVKSGSSTERDDDD